MTQEPAPHEGMIFESRGGLQVWRWPSPPPPKTAAEIAQETINALEREFLMPRIIRESLIVQAEERAAALGYAPAQLAVKNKGYAGLKALDAQITALRAQL